MLSFQLTPDQTEDVDLTEFYDAEEKPVDRIEIEFVADDVGQKIKLEELPQLKVCAHPETTTAVSAPVAETTTVVSTAAPPTTTAITTPKGELHQSTSEGIAPGLSSLLDAFRQHFTVMPVKRLAFTDLIPFIECSVGEEIPVEDGTFDVKDNDDSIPDEPASVFSPGVKQPNYKITVRPAPGVGSEPLVPMVITPTTGDNLKEVVVRIFPEDGSEPTEIVVSVLISYTSIQMLMVSSDHSNAFEVH